MEESGCTGAEGSTDPSKNCVSQAEQIKRRELEAGRARTKISGSFGFLSKNHKHLLRSVLLSRIATIYGVHLLSYGMIIPSSRFSAFSLALTSSVYGIGGAFKFDRVPTRGAQPLHPERTWTPCSYFPMKRENLRSYDVTHLKTSRRPVVHWSGRTVEGAISTFVRRRVFVKGPCRVSLAVHLRLCPVIMQSFCSK